MAHGVIVASIYYWCNLPNVLDMIALLLPPLAVPLMCAVQVAQEVSVSWVASRVLTTAQITGLKDRLDGWISRVNAASTTLEQESIGVALEVV